ncbi:MAG: ABC transporter permease [Candidatus Cyclobacteriaceae bacterium M3_2C_046]
MAEHKKILDTNGHHSPNYYVRKRLLRNKPAIFGLFVISFAIIITLLGYLIMPDKTPNANDGAVQLQKMKPGSRVMLLKIRKNMEVEQKSLIHRAIFGQESKYTIEPISDYRIEGDTLYTHPYGLDNKQEKSYALLKVVKALYIGEVNLEGFDNKNFRIEGDQITFLDLQKQPQTISRQSLIEEFKQNNLEERQFLLGTDKSGRDMLSRLLFGTRISLSIGFVAVVISMTLGLSLGGLAGFFGGKVDSLVMWLMSVVWSIPGIMLVIAISIALQSRGVWVAFVAVGLTMWVDVARVIRGQIMSIKEKLFIEAARAYGISNFRIVYFHILPNILGPLIVIATSNFAAAILLEAGLSFLGLSVQPPTPSWGIMIFEGYHAIGTQNSWHLVIFPALAICFMVLSFNLLGNGLRDAYDPKTLLK